MNVDFQRKVDRIAGSFLCRMLSLVPGTGRNAARFPPSKVLVILLSEMGSLILAQPMFRRLKERYPKASLYVLTFQQNKEVLDVTDSVDESNVLTVRNTSLTTLAKDSVRAVAKMRRLGIDTVIDCELFSRVSSIYARLSGAKARVGFHRYTLEGLYRGDFINRPVLYNPYQHIAHQFLSLVEAIEHTGRPHVKRRIDRDDTRLSPMAARDEEIRGMAERMRHDFPHLPAAPLVLLNPGGGLLPIRAWPLENYVAVARDLVRNGVAVGVIGLERDKILAREIRSACPDDACVDLTGFTATVRDLMILFHLASLLITNDGGPGHFASLTPLPAIILFGPETPDLYGPLDAKSYTFYSHFACSPCLTAYNHRNSPCDGDNRCLSSVSPKAVLDRAYEILRSRHE